MILSERLSRNLQATNIQPIMVMELEGVPFLIGSDTIKKVPRYGDDIAYGDPDLFYGGLIPYSTTTQKTLISLDGSTTQIKQNLDPDKARGSGVSQMSIVLIDTNQIATKIASGFYGEVLFKRAKVWITFGNENAFNEDYILIFRGLVESVSSGQGKVRFNLNSPDQKKRQQLLAKADSQLDGAITNSDTTLTLDTIENIFVVPDHPSYAPKDTSIKTYVRIEDEIIEYTGISGLQLTGCLRGQFSTTAVAHADEAKVESFYLLEGNCFDLALKIMMSDPDQSSYETGMVATSVGFDGVSVIPNIIYFADLNLTRDRNVQIGDWIKSTLFTNGANNLSSWTEILDVVEAEQGSYIVVDASLVYEATTVGEVEFLSQYNTLGFGLGMNPDDIDIDKHVEIRNSYLSTFNMRFYIRDEIEEGKEFIEKELYLPSSCYSLPTDREGLARSSVGIHKQPLPNAGIVTISRDNISRPDTLEVQRSVNKNYYNSVVMRYEDSPLDPELRRRIFAIVGTQTIPTGNKTLLIDSLGLKDFWSAKTIAPVSAARLLDRYKSAAEYMDGVQVQFSDGVQISVGDVVVFDPTGLNLISNETNDRNKLPLLMECVNKTLDIKNGQVKLELVDTSFNIDARFGLISPASIISRIITQTKFVITYQNAPSIYGSAEYRKWNKLKRPKVRIRRPDYSLVWDTTLLTSTSNTVTVDGTPPFTLQEDDIMEFSPYSSVTDQQKLIYSFHSNGTNNFPDGQAPYVLI